MKKLTIAILMLGTISTGLVTPAMADKQDWNHHGRDDDWKYKKQGQPERYRFDDRSRVVIYNYYGKEARNGRCPPGLAKKHNGCMAPGQARYWQVGKPLPRSVHYTELPVVVLKQLPPAPRNYRYVQVASDVLMIAVGTGMVVDAIQDITR
ncbi:RcnB family protein [Leeia sp. TBRC 13508]|uniref:RcnB family protein n=1 Tax=Leeia speluncae TaxID=2884804 RepID=A0ABS8D8W8_9NEIS|nr:RcnB family protein [Leeia speluncae]MCB6184635.1 RcnB family protein [Leeia speluncae]